MFTSDLFSSIIDVVLNTGGLTGPGPVIETTKLTNYDNGFTYDISLPTQSYVPSNSSVYEGSLSAHGNMVAMQVSGGSYKYEASSDPTNVDADGNRMSVIKPYLTGYLREYWRDPAKTTLGNNSAIPALTGVMPVQFVLTPGNALYYMDLQMTRLSGSNYWNNYHFISAFQKLIKWSEYNRNYLESLRIAQTNQIKYSGYDSLLSYLTQGFDLYYQGTSLRLALNNLGRLIMEVPNGYFGTSNAVANFLLKQGLGDLGGLREKLVAANVNFNDIYNPIYTQSITEILLSINNQKTLSTIQGYLMSNIPNIKSLNDYTSIEACAGIANDSVFQSFIDMGKDLYKKSANFYVATGADLVNIINSVNENIPKDLYSKLLTEKNTAQNTTVLNSIAPQSVNATTVFEQSIVQPNDSITQPTLYDVIGCATGYLTQQLNQVNSGIDQLSASQYGTLIHNALNAISIAFSNMRSAYLHFDPDKPWSQNLIYQNYDTGLMNQYNIKVQEYYSLLNTIAADPSMQSIVTQINTNWDDLCSKLNSEVQNYNKSNITTEYPQSNSAIFEFVENFPNYAIDSVNLDVDKFLQDLCQQNEAGDSVQTAFSYYKNQIPISRIGLLFSGWF